MSTEYLKKVIKQFAEIGGTTLVLGGGEPFTREDLLKIIKFADNLGLYINIETNGVLIDKRILKYKKRNITFVISLDGIKPKTHDSFRRMPGAFIKTIKNINFLLRNNFKVRITTVLTKENLNEIKDIIKYCIKSNMEHRLLPIITEGGRGSTCEARNLALTPRHVINYIKKKYLPIYKKYKQKNKHKSLSVDLPRAILPKEIETFSRCAWGTNMVGVNHMGEICLCHYVTDEKPYIAGKINKKNLANLWFNTKVFKNIRKINWKTLKGICSNCIYVKQCRGLCRLLTFQKYKNIYAPYPLCQELYENGLFPKENIINPKKDCTF